MFFPLVFSCNSLRLHPLCLVEEAPGEWSRRPGPFLTPAPPAIGTVCNTKSDWRWVWSVALKEVTALLSVGHLALLGERTFQGVLLWSVAWIWLMVGQTKERNWVTDGGTKQRRLTCVWIYWLSYERLPRSSVFSPRCGVVLLNMNRLQIFLYLTLQCVSFPVFPNVTPFKHVVIFLISQGYLFCVNIPELES